MASGAKVRMRLVPKDGTTDWNASIAGIPLDGAHAFQRAVVEMFGSVEPYNEERNDMFGNTVAIGPTVIEVKTPAGRVPITWGKVKAPKYPYYFGADADIEHGKFVFQVSSKFQNEAQRQQLLKLVARAEEILKTDSLYRGRALELLPRAGDLVAPELLDLSGYTEDRLIFPEHTQNLLRQALFYPLRNTEACRQRGVRLKRGLLMGGKWGTGKTLTARVAASVGTENGWTFFYVKRPNMLSNALAVAVSYQPALVFVEDIDDVLENRDALSNMILNTLDGINTKEDEIMVVLTTNFLDRVDPALLRPGRMDTSIEMPTPDVPTIERMIRHYAPDLSDIPAGVLQPLAAKLEGQIPAVIHEVVERARLISMDEGADKIETRHLDASIESMKDHMTRLDRPPVKNHSLEHQVGSNLKKLMERAYLDA